jgi:ParB-like chromosome segregation protein Spo0J
VTTLPDLTVERVPWDSLTQHPRNPRNGDVDAIAESIRVNGVYRPVIIARDGTILAGHHLWLALREVGRTEVDVVRLPIHPASPEATRILLADNRTADLGNYDDGLLASLLRDLDTEVGIIGTGYDHDDLAALLASIEDPGRGFGVNDPEPARCPNCGYTLSGE